MSPPSSSRHGECGTTLIELVIVAAIVALAAGFGYAGLSSRPAQARTTALQFAALVAQARALAAITAQGGGSSGATIQVSRDGDDYVATLYAFRPVRGAQQPVAAARTIPLRTATALALASGDERIAPPFALFFSASGHAGAAAPFTVGTDGPLGAEPTCPAQTGIVVSFDDGVANQSYTLSCELAQLDIDTPATTVSAAAARP